MATSGVIIEKKEGHVLPRELVEDALKMFPNSVGAATIKDGSLHLIRQQATFDLDEFIKKQDQLKDTRTIFYFGRNDGSYMDEDLQPIVVLEDEGDPILVAFLEGDFPGGPPKTVHSNEYHLVDGYLAEKMEALWDLCDGDMEKMMAMMDKPATRKEMQNTWGAGGGTIVLMAVTGDMVVFSQNPDRIEGEWGWASDDCKLMVEPYDTKSKEDAAKSTSVPATGEKKLSVAERLALKKQQGPSATADPKTATAIPASVSPIEMKKIGPAPVHLNNAGKREWWATKLAPFGLGVPQGYKNPGCVVEIPASALKKAEEPVLPKKVEDKAVTEEVFPVIDPKIKQAIFEDLKNVVKETPEVREKNSKEFPNAASAVGIGLETTFSWDAATMKGIVCKYPTWGWVYAYNMRNLYIAAMMEMEKLTAPAGEKKEEQKLSVAERLALKKQKAA